MQPLMQSGPQDGFRKGRKVLAWQIQKFSPLSTGFSTGWASKKVSIYLCISVYISNFDGFLSFLHFFAIEKNDQTEKLYRKIILDRLFWGPERPFSPLAGGQEGKTEFF